jgi:hypothetical protein
MKRGLFILILFITGSAPAIIVSDYSVATNAPVGLNWSYVYNYKNSSAVAVGSCWILTAAHVADDGGTGSLTISGTNYYQQEIIFHNTADLALVRYDKVLPGFYPFYTGSFPSWFGIGKDKRLSVILVGFGNTGTVSATSWTDSGTGRGIKRWGSQKIDRTDTASYDVGGTTGSTTNSGVWMDFDSGNTANEAGVGFYDSGGGTFYNDGGTWKLAGINTTRSGDPNFTSTFSISMPDYQSWATNVMNPTGDLDGDGIPNYWEQQYGTTTGLTVSADNDSDDFTNFEEYLADTNPTNAASFFEMSGFMASEVQTVYFTGSTARQYQIFYTTNDLAATNVVWIAAHTNKIAGTGVNSAITVTNTQEKAFYRLRVTQP